MAGGLILILMFYGALIAPVIVWAFMVIRRLQKIVESLERMETLLKGGEDNEAQNTNTD